MSMSVLLWNTKSNSVTVTKEINLFEIKVVFCHLWLQSWTFWTRHCLLWIVFGSKSFLAISSYIPGLDKYNALKKYEERPSTE